MELNAALERGSECASLIIRGIRHRLRKCQTLIARMSANDHTCLHVLFFLQDFSNISHVYSSRLSAGAL